MKKRIYLIQLLFVLLHVQLTLAQSQNYIATDSVYTNGIVIPLDRTKLQFQKFLKDKPKQYTSDEVNEYGYRGKVFESLSQNGESQFYWRLAKSGRVKIFKQGVDYLVVENDSIKSMDKSNLIKRIEELSLCDHPIPKRSFSSAKAIDFNLSKIRNNCNSQDLLFKKVGIMAGYSNLRFEAETPDVFVLALKERWSGTGNFGTVGLFLDFPLFKPKNLFFSTEATLTFGSAKLIGKSSSIDIATSQFSAPISLKWFFLNRIAKPYIKGGIVLSRISIHASTSSTSIGSDKFTNSDLAYGIQAALGAKIPIKGHRALQLELSYMELARRNFDKLDISMSGISFMTAYVF